MNLICIVTKGKETYQHMFNTGRITCVGKKVKGLVVCRYVHGTPTEGPSEGSTAADLAGGVGIWNSVHVASVQAFATCPVLCQAGICLAQRSTLGVDYTPASTGMSHKRLVHTLKKEIYLCCCG